MPPVLKLGSEGLNHKEKEKNTPPVLKLVGKGVEP
jgi:hypothetical protein